MIDLDAIERKCAEWEEFYATVPLHIETVRAFCAEMKALRDVEVAARALPACCPHHRASLDAMLSRLDAVRTGKER